MKEWRVILVLLAVIALLGTILAVKIINNTPEKQMQEIQVNYEKTEDKTTSIFDRNNTGWYFSAESEDKNEQEKSSWVSDFLSTPLGLIIGILVTVFMIIGNIQLYIKLHISSNLIGMYIKLIWAVVITGALCIVPFLGIVTAILPLILIGEVLILFVIQIILEYKFFKALNTSFWFILLTFIPYVGTIILNIILGIRLSNEFNKGIIFKIGLCIAPNIFRPILGLTAQE